MMKDHDQSSLGGKYMLPYTVHHQTEGEEGLKQSGTWRQELIQSHKWVLLTDLFHMAGSGCFLTERTSSSPGWPTTQWSGLFHNNHQFRRCLPNLPMFLPSYGHIFSIETYLFSDDSNCVRLTYSQPV